MQAVLTSMNELNNMGYELCTLFDKLDTADNSAKNSIENDIVGFGDKAIDFLIGKLTGSKGVQRGVAAMSLIRIGESAISSLRELAAENKNYEWVANYIIQEIEGTF